MIQNTMASTRLLQIPKKTALNKNYQVAEESKKNAKSSKNKIRTGRAAVANHKFEITMNSTSTLPLQMSMHLKSKWKPLARNSKSITSPATEHCDD